MKPSVVINEGVTMLHLESEGDEHIVMAIADELGVPVTWDNPHTHCMLSLALADDYAVRYFVTKRG